jgi:hypothetical protein
MAFPDLHKNFAYSTVLTAPSPAASGLSLVVQSGDGAKFPAVPFNATVWPAGAQPISTNAEIVRVTTVATDTFTLADRTTPQEGSSSRSIAVGDQIAASITNLALTNIEGNYMNSWSPYIVASAGTGLQSLASASVQTSSASLFVFPVTIPNQLRFNQVLIGNSLISASTNTSGTQTQTYYSLFGIYSMTGNTLSRISSNSFSIVETGNSVSLTWNYPTSTATSGYAYGSFPAGNLTTTAQISSYIAGSRVVGLQFGGEMTLSAGMYWLGLLSLRSTAGVSSLGISHAGIIGQIIASNNSIGAASGLLPLGSVSGDWQNAGSHLSGWLGYGRYMMGFLTATSINNFRGSMVPASIAVSQLMGTAAASTGSILPSVTFVST